ncbi:MAG: anaerobic sulfatase maturase [bacterium]|jgi:uncharacterized protein
MVTQSQTFDLPVLQPARRKLLQSVLIKPTGPDCNLDCTYCFYLQKSALFPEQKVHRMTVEILEEMVRQVMQTGHQQLSFGWQGGEPTMMGVEFFRKAVEFQKTYGRPGQSVGNGLQTNGILIDDEWCELLREYNFLVGLSLDGPEHVHDKYRFTLGGRPSHKKVEETARRLLGSEVATNALVVVNDYSCQYAEEIYEYHKSLGFEFMQFIPCVEPDPANPAQAASFSVTAEQYGQFLCDIFDCWKRDFQDGRPTTSVRYIDSVFHTYVGIQPPECTLLQECGCYVVVEHNGDIYSCDFFVEPEWKLGNIMEGNVQEMLNSPRQNEFGRWKAQMPQECHECEYLQHCYGGCTKDRLRDPQDHGSNHFCQSYKMFFAHADTELKRLADEWLDQQRQEEEAQRRRYTEMVQARTGRKAERNDPCPCGSGRKYKKCCGR